MDPGPNILAVALAEALDRRLCVSAWIGHRCVLFLGLGNGVIAERQADGSRPHPPFELQTNLAEWTVESPEGPLIADTDSGRARMAAQALVGRHVVGWHVSDEYTLRVQFYGGPALTVTPMADGRSADKSAWWICLPGGRVVAVSCDGRVVAADSRRATCDWFAG